MHQPCDQLARCVNLSPGFRCEPCPNGFDGHHANGYYAQTLTDEYQRQTCHDIDECALGLAQCGEHAQCENTIGSYLCNCHRGFNRNETFGCQPAEGVCPDGTYCDRNAYCKLAEGISVSLHLYSFVFIYMHSKLFNLIVLIKIFLHLLVPLCLPNWFRW